MNKDTALQYLHNALQPDGNIRAEAERAIKSFIQSSFQDSLTLFIQIIFDTSVPQPSRQICSIIVKNCLHSKNQRLQKSYESNWLSCPIEFRSNFISLLNKNLDCKEQSIFSNITKIYGSIIRIETSNRTGIDILKTLQAGISNQSFAVGILESIAHACDQLYEETLYEFGNEKHDIFNISMFYLKPGAGPSRNIIFSTLRCILSCLEVFEDILSSENARHEFIYKIFATEKPDSEVLEISLEVINRFVDVYSCLTDSELMPICQFYLSYFDSKHDEVPLQIFDFWSLLLELEKYTILKPLVSTLVPNLLLCITKEDVCDLSPSPHKAACSLLMDITSKMKILLLSDQMYQNFILNNLSSSELEKHAIGATALGCICTAGSDDFLYQVLPILINDLGHDECVNEALFAIARVCENDISLAVNFLPTIIQKVGILIESRTKVAVNAVLVYNSILLSMKADIVKEVENIVLFHYSDILSILVYRLDQAEPSEYELRSVLNLTLSELILCCPSSHKNILDQLQSYLLTKVKSAIQTVKTSVDQQFLVFDDVLCSYIVLLESCLSMKKIFDADEIAEVFIQCLLLPKMLVQGEIYIVISKLLTHFSIYLKRFIPFALRDISSDESFVLKSALNLLSDCAILLESNFIEFTNTVIPALANAITSPDVSLEIKPRIIVSLGDIALAVGKSFEPYVSLCVMLLTQINTLSREGDEDYVDNLRKAVIQLFSCLFLSVGNTDEMRLSLNEILSNIKVAIQHDKESAYVKESLNIICDIQTIFGTDKITEDWVVKFLHEVIRNSTGNTGQKAKEILETIY
ncbi:uncharacterized protein VICG_00105 [Vittaforma corneae ATCC 50505]|uniref:Importin subunit beta-1/Transportin-1-like TPR repeats domain-containing protein n=1 Tax=Vittaforma corneae (strain ATCC 50505) TaxID=993615 RepID=L2GQJ5_VITCO|nr:uncharacterized protein VICG_00105 [Vittaforma corneae ATCC 50505]ELA42790.1 hypothetical protein VICG_00105 [Vittaforma corneae ATCC 50505]